MSLARDVIAGIAFVCIFAGIGWVAYTGSLRDSAYYDRINKCVVENKELPQPREYCKAAISQGIY